MNRSLQNGILYNVYMRGGGLSLTCLICRNWFQFSRRDDPVLRTLQVGLAFLCGLPAGSPLLPHESGEQLPAFFFRGTIRRLYLLQVTLVRIPVFCRFFFQFSAIYPRYFAVL